MTPAHRGTHVRRPRQDTLRDQSPSTHNILHTGRTNTVSRVIAHKRLDNGNRQHEQEGLTLARVETKQDDVLEQPEDVRYTYTWRRIPLQARRRTKIARPQEHIVSRDGNCDHQRPTNGLKRGRGDHRVHRELRALQQRRTATTRTRRAPRRTKGSQGVEKDCRPKIGRHL